MARVEYDRYTPEEYQNAAAANGAEYLMSIGYELKRSAGCYKGKVHDSLVIRDDGRWYWNSRGFGGHSPIGLVKTILLADYGYGDEIQAAISAVKRLAGTEGCYIPCCMASGRGSVSAGVGPKSSADRPAPRYGAGFGAAYDGARGGTYSAGGASGGVTADEHRRRADEPLPLPAPFRNNQRAIAYLCQARGLDAEIVAGLIRYGKIFETCQRWDKEKERFVDTPYHNAVFVSYDKDKRPQSAFLRGTLTNTDKPFKRELESSDKSYSFTLSGRKESDRVFCFEAAIDAISHASYYKLTGQDWRDGHRLALGGTCLNGLERFLNDNPQVRGITVCVDNDDAGHKCAEKLEAEYTARGYAVDLELPGRKDWNDELLAEREGEAEYADE